MIQFGTTENAEFMFQIPTSFPGEVSEATVCPILYSGVQREFLRFGKACIDAELAVVYYQKPLGPVMLDGVFFFK